MRYTDRTLEALEQDYLTDKPMRRLTSARRWAILFLILGCLYALIGHSVAGVVASSLDLVLIMVITHYKDKRQRKIRSKYLL